MCESLWWDHPSSTCPILSIDLTAPFAGFMFSLSSKCFQYKFSSFSHVASINPSLLLLSSLPPFLDFFHSDFIVAHHPEGHSIFLGTAPGLVIRNSSSKEIRRLQLVREEVECLLAHRQVVRARLCAQWVEQSETYGMALQANVSSEVLERTHRIFLEVDVECVTARRSLDEARAFLAKVD